MQIQNLDQSVYTYIGESFQPAVSYQCYMSFFLAEQFGLSNYDESFVDLIAVREDVEPDELRDIFIEKVHRLLNEVLVAHHITLDPHAGATLDELIELAHFLDLASKLEDPTILSPRLSDTFDTPRRIFADLVGMLSHLEPWRVLELVEQVEPSLIQALRKMTEDRLRVTPVSMDDLHRKDLIVFSQFVGTHECLGLKLLDSGYRKLTWDALADLISVDLSTHFAKLGKTSIAQCALDLVSLAVLAKDSYQTPGLAIQKRLPGYIDDRELVTKVYASVMAILTDYQTARDVYKQQQKVN